MSESSDVTVPRAGDPDWWPDAALEEARRLDGLFQVADAFARHLEARVMESVWRIRETLPDRDRFVAFIGACTPPAAEAGVADGRDLGAGTPEPGT